MRSIMLACCFLVIAVARADSTDEKVGCSFTDVLLISDVFSKNESTIGSQKQKIEDLEWQIEVLSASKCTCL